MFIRNPEEIESLDITESELFPILSTLDIGIMITDDQGEITYYNPKHALMDALAVEDVVGRKVTDVYHLNEGNSLVMRCLHSKRPIVECPVIYKTRDGQIVDSIHHVFPLVKSGKVTGAISFIFDYQRVDAESTSGDMLQTTQLNFTGDTDYSLDDIIGSSVPILDSVSRARMAAQTDSPVLIYGETGTGKELFAQSIHNLSRRREARYIAVNCAAIPENLLEGILFGTSKGAFTGALDKAGLFERANGGTLFLDEINSMTKEMQPKLLRVIQERKVCRIGSHRDQRLDVKIISSINNTLEHAILAGEVRRDLLYRLSVVYLSLPPLRARKGDISILTGHFLKKYNKRMSKKVTGVSTEVMNLFENHDWPGNVRELEHIIEGSMNMVGKDRLLERWHLMTGFDLFGKSQNDSNNYGQAVVPQPSRQGEIDSGNWQESSQPPVPSRGARDEEPEKREILEALSDADGNISDAAVIMGISRQTFYRKIKALNINIPKKSGDDQRKLIISNLEQYEGNITHTARAMGISRQLLAYRMKKMGIDRSSNVRK